MDVGDAIGAVPIETLPLFEQFFTISKCLVEVAAYSQESLAIPMLAFEGDEGWDTLLGLFIDPLNEVADVPDVD